MKLQFICVYVLCLSGTTSLQTTLHNNSRTSDVHHEWERVICPGNE